MPKAIFKVAMIIYLTIISLVFIGLAQIIPFSSLTFAQALFVGFIYAVILSTSFMTLHGMKRQIKLTP